MLKNEARVCPLCGSDDTCMEDYAIDVDRLWTKHRCKDCQAIWGEYYTVSYGGYLYDDKSYDADGKENEE